MKTIEQNYQTIKSDILQGNYGVSGTRFVSVRELCNNLDVPFSNGYNIFQKLKSESLIVGIKQKWFITYGVAPITSDIRAVSNQKLVGCHAKEINNPYITAIISALRITLDKLGYKLIIQTSENNSNNEIEALNTFISLGCVGVINFPSTETKIVDYYKNYPLPMVFIGRKIMIDEKNAMPSVLTDNYETGIIIAHTLLDKGYKSFYFVTHKNFSSNINKRLMGFRVELNKKKSGLFTDENVLEVEYSDTPSIRAFCRKVVKEANANNPTAIFCINDLFAAKILTTLIPMKADIPNLIGIVGYDDLPVSEYTYPTITSVSYSLKEMASQAVKLLFLIDSDSIKNNLQIKIPNFVIQRKSTAREITR